MRSVTANAFPVLLSLVTFGVAANVLDYTFIIDA